jgi:hypothetical protein
MSEEHTGHVVILVKAGQCGLQHGGHGLDGCATLLVRDNHKCGGQEEEN